MVVTDINEKIREVALVLQGFLVGRGKRDPKSSARKVAEIVREKLEIGEEFNFKMMKWAMWDKRTFFYEIDERDFDYLFGTGMCPVICGNCLNKLKQPVTLRNCPRCGNVLRDMKEISDEEIEERKLVSPEWNAPMSEGSCMRCLKEGCEETFKYEAGEKFCKKCRAQS